MTSIYSLSKDEIEILRQGKENPSVITNYFFREKDAEKGFIFDYNFTPEGKWQEMVCRASQTRIVVIGGFGTGKTQGIAMSACVWAITTLDFKFMNVAPVSWQSELMYRFIVDMAEDTPFNKLIYKKTERPYPKIILKFYVGHTLLNSSMEFMSVDKNANKVLSWDGDWINADEAGLIDDLEGTIRNVGSRLRGRTKRGRPRLGRLSLCSNSWDNPQLWYRFDLASSLPENLSLIISTRSNKNITEAQLRDMVRDVPEDEREQFIEGNRPVGEGKYFSNNAVHACENKIMSDIIIERVKAKDPKYILGETTLAGVVVLETPVIDGHTYILIADPGTGEAPSRNAPSIMVWDLTEMPKNPAVLVALWWGEGHGAITPFLIHYFRLMTKYKPIFNGVDSTGTQKNTAELLNQYIAEKQQTQNISTTQQGWLSQIDLTGILDPKIHGLDFSGSKKPMYLITARLMIEAKLMIWPSIFVGLRAQLTNYDPAKDKTGEPKIAQDLVCAFAMSAHTIRSLYHLSVGEMFGTNKSEDDDNLIEMGARGGRLSDEARNSRVGTGDSDNGILSNEEPFPGDFPKR